MEKNPHDTPEVVLDRLEASIQEALHRLIDHGRISDEHRDTAEAFRKRLGDLQRKLRASRGGERADMPTDVKSDFDLLAWDYKRWLAEIDKDFEDREPKRPIFGRGAP